MTTHDRDKIIAAAKEAGSSIVGGDDGTEKESLRQQLAIRDAEVERLEKVSVFKEECRQSIEQQLASRDAEVAKAFEAGRQAEREERDQLRKDVTLLRDALKKERNLRVLGRSPNISWESTREIRRNVYRQTDEVLDATEPKP